jgi:hypothetical protein
MILGTPRTQPTKPPLAARPRLRPDPPLRRRPSPPPPAPTHGLEAAHCGRRDRGMGHCRPLAGRGRQVAWMMAEPTTLVLLDTDNQKLATTDLWPRVTGLAAEPG